MPPSPSPPPADAPAAPDLAAGAARKTVDLRNYAPAYLSWISNKLSRGASQAYLAAFDVGIEVWRILVLLAIEPALSAQHICRVMGMDKAQVSRCFKSMQAKGLIRVALDPRDGRLRIASITPAGRELHDSIYDLALERERALLSGLSAEERAQLLRLLHKVHDSLGLAEEATRDFLAAHHPGARRRRG
ncbi:MarR family winged helix-turn-helix transcriptional regulator [Thiomonas sp. FB-6]|uniref:MarR family winged helix-turn-helix transcriptional regulator n=1 Tax=Thiomonas sp. FB-6 TaxID=1158291 RepID=UPI000360B311|nr:MarR family transcriptional regulator [Thiomonas sp. FB-6]